MTIVRSIVQPDSGGLSSRGDFASGGSIGSVVGFPFVAIAQTTAAKVLTIPTPADSAAYRVIIANTGTAGFWMYGRFIRPGGSHEFVYLPSVGWRRTASGDQVIAQSAVALTVPADTNENTLVSFTIPGGVIGANGFVIVNDYWRITSNSNNKTLRIKYGSSVVSTHTATTTTTYGRLTLIANRGSEASQIGTAGAGTGAQGSPSTATVDTSADFTFSITGQKASAGDDMILEAYSVTVRRFD